MPTQKSPTTRKPKASKPQGYVIVGEEDSPYIYKIVMPEERPMSVNRIWAGIHWKTRSSYKNKVKDALTAILKQYGCELIDEKVDISLVCRMKNTSRSNLYDSDNVVIKPYIDSLRGIILKDDTTNYVGRVCVEVLADNETPGLEIIILRREDVCRNVPS